MQSKPQSRTQLLDDTLQTLYDLVTLRLSAAVAGWIEFELTFAQLQALLVLSRRGKLVRGELAILRDGMQVELGRPASASPAPRHARQCCKGTR